MDELEAAQQYLERTANFSGTNTSLEHLSAVVVFAATLRAQLTEAREREAVKDVAIAKALAIHDRYCDRVGVADSSWIGAVHAALRDAAALARGGEK